MPCIDISIGVPTSTPEVIEICLAYAEQNNAITYINGIKHYALMFPDSVADWYTRSQALAQAVSAE